MDMHLFYNILNRRGYYNLFLRVKKPLLEKDIIEMKKIMSTKIIKLTEKGSKLKELMKKVVNIADGELFGRGTE